MNDFVLVFTTLSFSIFAFYAGYKIAIYRIEKRIIKANQNRTAPIYFSGNIGGIEFRDADQPLEITNMKIHSVH